MSHFSAKFVTSASARGSASMRSRLRLERLRVVQLARLGELEQLVVRSLAPEEERRGARRARSRRARKCRGARRGFRRRDRAIEEIRAREHRRHHLLDARIEAAARAAGFVERHQALDVVLRHGPAERAPRESLGDALGAGSLLVGGLGLADEQFRAAQRARHARRLERALRLRCRRSRAARAFAP